MKHKKMKQKRHRLIKERKNVPGEPGDLIAKRYFMYLEKFQTVGFLDPLKMRLIAETFAHIPTSYFFGEDHNDWWNYYQMGVDFGGLFPCRIGLSINKIKQSIQTRNISMETIAVQNFKEATPSGTDFDSLDPSTIFYTKPEDIIEVSNEPIIVLSEFEQSNRVIDGNHRVDDAIRNNQTEISAFIITNQFLLNNDCFDTPYDNAIFKAHVMFYEAYKNYRNSRS
jgi:hypothetical protein